MDPGYALGRIFIVADEFQNPDPVSNPPIRTELNAAANSATLYGLKPNTAYTVYLGYQPFAAGSAEELTDIVQVSTQAVSAYIRPTRLTGDRIYFTLNLDPQYPPVTATVKLYAGASNTAEDEYTLSPSELRSAVSAAGVQLGFGYPPGYAYLTLGLGVEYPGMSGPAETEMARTTVRNTTASASAHSMMAVDDSPAETPAEQQPAAPAEQQPAAPEQQQPAAPAEQQPAAPAEQQPAEAPAEQPEQQPAGTEATQVSAPLRADGMRIYRTV
jgi:hypothetical protein